jgi:heme/copper-type cytochrome/quinol oxidase subunit 2
MAHTIISFVLVFITVLIYAFLTFAFFDYKKNKPESDIYLFPLLEMYWYAGTTIMVIFVPVCI